MKDRDLKKQKFSPEFKKYNKLVECEVLTDRLCPNCQQDKLVIIAIGLHHGGPGNFPEAYTACDCDNSNWVWNLSEYGGHEDLIGALTFKGFSIPKGVEP